MKTKGSKAKAKRKAGVKDLTVRKAGEVKGASFGVENPTTIGTIKNPVITED